MCNCVCTANVSKILVAKVASSLKSWLNYYYLKSGHKGTPANKEGVDIVMLQEVHLIQGDLKEEFIPLENYTYEQNLLTEQMAKKKYLENKTGEFNRKFKKDEKRINEEIQKLNLNDFRKSEGMITLINKRWMNKYEVIKDPNKRYLIIVIDLPSERYFLVNIYYAPSGNRKAEMQKANKFYDNLSARMKMHILNYNISKLGKKISNVIIGGDFNMVLNQKLDRESNTTKTDYINKRNESLRKLMLNLQLKDAYRYLHRKRMKFTYRSVSAENVKLRRTNSKEVIFRSRARLDFFLIKNSMRNNIIECYIMKQTKYNSDHSPVFLQYKISNFKIQKKSKAKNIPAPPRLKTKEMGIEKLKEWGTSYEFNEKVLSSYTDWKNAKNFQDKIARRNRVFEDITLDIYDYFEQRTGVTKGYRGRLSWSVEALKDPITKKMKLIRRKCTRLLKAIYVWYRNQRGRQSKIENRVNNLYQHWEKLKELPKEDFQWVRRDPGFNGNLIRKIKQLRNVMVKNISQRMRAHRCRKFQKQ